jgi:single-strand DNA-binding protein
MIKLQIIGNLGKDAVINNVGGKQVINFSVAHTEKFTSNGEQKEKTIWVECAYWSESKVGPYLKKGTQVFAEGSPEVKTYSRNDGGTGTSLTLRVFSIQLLGGNKDEGHQQNSAPAVTATNNSSNVTAPIDDLPF